MFKRECESQEDLKWVTSYTKKSLNCIVYLNNAPEISIINLLDALIDDKHQHYAYNDFIMTTFLHSANAFQIGVKTSDCLLRLGSKVNLAKAEQIDILE